MIRVPVKPCSGRQKEISSQGVDANEVIGEFPVSDMLVISLSGFVVEAENAHIRSDQREAILEVMLAAPQRFRHTPHHDFREHAVAQPHAFAEHPYRIHHTVSPV
jgi:hypothetical protein